MQRADQWNSEAQSLIYQQSPFNINNPESILQYDSVISALLAEQKHLPVQSHLFTLLSSIQEANRKATQIINSLAYRDEGSVELLDSLRLYDLNEIRAHMEEIALHPSKKGSDISQNARAFFQAHSPLILEVLEPVIMSDLNKLKRASLSAVRLGKLKEISVEFEVHCQNCSTSMKEGFQSINSSLNLRIAKYDSWLMRVSSMVQVSAIKKRNKKNTTELTENEQLLKGDALYYLRLPYALLLYLEALNNSFYCPDTLELYKYLEQTYREIHLADSILSRTVNYKLKQL